MIFVTRFDGDTSGGKDWFEVFGTKREAMTLAKEIAESDPERYAKGVEYLDTTKPDCPFYMDFENQVVVEKRHSIYHGA